MKLTPTEFVIYIFQRCLKPKKPTAFYMHTYDNLDNTMAGQTSIESFDENQMTACERRKMCTCDFDGPCFTKKVVKINFVKQSTALEEKSESSHLDPNDVSKSNIITKITDYFQKESDSANGAKMLDDQSNVESKVLSEPKDIFISTKNQPIEAPSLTPLLGCHVGLKFIEDESLFNLDSLTCHACNDKTFKNAKGGLISESCFFILASISKKSLKTLS